MAPPGTKLSHISRCADFHAERLGHFNRRDLVFRLRDLESIFSDSLRDRNLAAHRPLLQAATPPEQWITAGALAGTTHLAPGATARVQFRHGVNRPVRPDACNIKFAVALPLTARDTCDTALDVVQQEVRAWGQACHPFSKTFKIDRVEYVGPSRPERAARRIARDIIRDEKARSHEVARRLAREVVAKLPRGS